MTWSWLGRGHLKRETSFLLMIAQNKAIRTNYIKATNDNTQKNSKFRLCGDRDETFHHMINKCIKLGLKEIKD